MASLLLRQGGPHPLVGHDLEAVRLDQGVGEVPRHRARVRPGHVGHVHVRQGHDDPGGGHPHLVALLDEGALGLLDHLGHREIRLDLQNPDARHVAVQAPQHLAGVGMLELLPLPVDLQLQPGDHLILGPQVHQDALPLQADDLPAHLREGGRDPLGDLGRRAPKGGLLLLRRPRAGPTHQQRRGYDEQAAPQISSLHVFPPLPRHISLTIPEISKNRQSQRRLSPIGRLSLTGLASLDAGLALALPCVSNRE